MIKELVKKATELEAKEPSFYCKEWLPIPKNAITMISSPSGMGKSFLAIQLAIRSIIENPTNKVLLWLSEDPAFYIKERIDKIFEKIIFPELNCVKEDILKQIDVIAAESETFYINDSETDIKTLKKELVEYNIVVFDPLIAFYKGDENNNSEAKHFMNILNEIAKEDSLSIILIHHHNKKEKNTTRGASAFVDAVRLLYTIEKIGEDEEINSTKRLIKIEKDNWGVKQLFGISEFEKEILPYHGVKKRGIKSKAKKEEKLPIIDLI